MYFFEDPDVLQLYLTVRRDSDEPMVGDVQRYAIDLLDEMARGGNSEASRALNTLASAPTIHPLLCEQIRQKST